jgi:hypothetical protein
MADTKRVALYLDNDAVELLAELAPSDYRKGKFVSGLIRQAAQQQDPQAQTYADIGRHVVQVVQRAMQIGQEGTE